MRVFNISHFTQVKIGAVTELSAEAGDLRIPPGEVLRTLAVIKGTTQYSFRLADTHHDASGEDITHWTYKAVYAGCPFTVTIYND